VNQPREVPPRRLNQVGSEFPLRTVLRRLLVVASLICAPLSASTFTFTGLVSASWSNPANWLQDGLPATQFPGQVGFVDDVVIDGPFSVTMNVAGISIGNLSLPATVSVSNITTTLTLSQDLIVNGTVSVLAHTNGAITAQSQLQLSGHFLTVNGGSVTVQGQTVGITATATLADGSTGALVFNGSGVLGGSNSNVTLYDLTIGSFATATLASSISVSDTVRVSAFGTLELQTNTLTVGALGNSLVVDGTIHSGISGGQLTIPKNIGGLFGAGSIDVFNLTLSAGTGGGQTTVLQVPTTVRNVLSFAVKHTLSVSTTLTFTGGAGFPLNPLSGTTASLSFNSGAVLVYAESSNTLIDRTFLSGNYQTLRVSLGAAATATYSPGANTINGNLEVLSGRLALTGSTAQTIGGNVVVLGTLDCSAYAGSLTVNGGSMTFGGIAGFNAPLSVNLNGTGSLTVPSGTIQFNTLTLGSVGTTTFSGGGTTRVTGPLTVGPSHVLQGGLTPSDTGTLEIAGSGTSFLLGAGAAFLASNLTVRYTNTAATTTVLATPYHNLNIATATRVASFTSASLAVDNLTVESGTLQLNTTSAAIANFVSIASGTLQMASGTMTVGGSWTNSGSFASGTSTVVFNSSAAGFQVISASNFTNVTIASAGGARATGSLTLSGMLLISTALTSDAFTHTIGGNWTNNGVFTPGGSTVVFNGLAQTIDGSSATAFNNLTINGGFTVNVALPPGPPPIPPSVTVAGTLTLNAMVTVNAPRVLAVGASGSVVRTTGRVVGNLRKTFVAAGTKSFEVGTANGYSPVSVTTPGTGDLTISAVQGPHPNAVGANVLQRYWRITNGGLSSADLTLNYLPADAVGSELSYLLAEFAAGGWSFPPGAAVNASTHVASVTGVTSFGDFTAGERASLSPLPTHLAVTAVNGGSSPVAGTTFPVVVEARDASDNPAQVASTTSIALSRAAGTGVLLGTVTGTIAANTSSVTINGPVYFKAESGVAITAARTAGDALSSGTSSPFTVVPGPAAKLQILLPGQSADPGSGSGFSGTAANQASGAAFMVTVNAVDGFWNLINTAADMVSITSSDPQATLPASAPLVGGTRSFFVTLANADVATVTASAAPLSSASATLLVVPGAPAPATSTITALPTTVIANGTDASVIRVQVKDAAGNNVTAGGSTVILATTRGTLTSVTDHLDGTYTSSLTSTTGGTATISGTLNGQPLSNQATVTFTATLSTPFTDDPIVAGVTIVKAIHITELRDAVNFVRWLAGLPPATFTTPVVAGSIIQTADITELRSALAEARVGLPPVTYTDANLTAGTPVKAVHIQELREASRVILAKRTQRAEARRRICITVTPPAPAAFTSGVPMSAAFAQSGATGTAAFALASGSLPQGLVLASTGVLSGTPSQTGTFPITATATDRNGCSGTSPAYTLRIVAMPDIMSFAADPAQIPPGSSTNLLPVFADGVGVITNSHDATAVVTASGAQMTVSPSTDTTYTLTVTNAAGEQTTRSVAVSVSDPAIVRFDAPAFWAVGKSGLTPVARH